MFRKEIRIKNIFWLAGLIMIFTVPMWAQVSETFPRGEVFLGYSFSRIDPARDSNRVNANGWEGSVSGNLNRYFGLVADFAGHYGSVDRAFGQNIASVNIRSHEFLFGPRGTIRTERATVFGHVLVGADRLSRGGFTFISPSQTFQVFPRTVTKLALGFGGGVDFTINRNVSFRAIQVDYLPVRRGPGAFGGPVTFGNFFEPARWSNNFRIGTGVVLTFGAP